MAVMILWTRVRSSRKKTGKWINPCTGTEDILNPILIGAVQVGTARAKMLAEHIVTAEATVVFRCCRKGVFEPGLTDLFEPLGVINSSAHPIQILGNDRVIVAWQCEPIHIHLPVVARFCSYCQANPSASVPELL